MVFLLTLKTGQTVTLGVTSKNKVFFRAGAGDFRFQMRTSSSAARSAYKAAVNSGNAAGPTAMKIKPLLCVIPRQTKTTDRPPSQKTPVMLSLPWQQRFGGLGGRVTQA